MSVDAYPLTWPAAWPRTARPADAVFRTGLADARDGLLRELSLLGARGVVLSSNARLNRDGSIAARQGRIDDAGVCAYFALDGEERAIPCDRWATIEDNLQAIRLTVAALRGIGRWGAGEMVSAAFRGFAALPEPRGEGWWTVLGVEPDADRARVEAAYRRLAKDRHPDAGGGADAFRALADAYERAKEALR